MMENNFVKVKGVGNPETVELPLDLDNTLSLTVLSSQFPHAAGLKFKNPKNNQIRTVRRIDGKFLLSPDLKWMDYTFFCVYPPSKLKILQPSAEKALKYNQDTLETIFSKFPETYDLIAIGLSYDTTGNDLYNYLTRFGKLMYCRLKYDDILGHSRGIAFFRFADIRAQNLCLSAIHMVDKTKITIKVPNEKLRIKESTHRKLYVSNVPKNLSREDLRTYFSQYGQVIHVFVPPDKRCFAFVTFIDDKAIKRVLNKGQTHSFNGAKVNVSRVVEKTEQSTEKTEQAIEKIELPSHLSINSNDDYNTTRILKRKNSSEPGLEKLNDKKNSTQDYLTSLGNCEVRQQSTNNQLQPSVVFNTPDFTQPPPFLFPHNFIPQPHSISADSGSLSNQSLCSQPLYNFPPPIYSQEFHQPTNSSLQYHNPHNSQQPPSFLSNYSNQHFLHSSQISSPSQNFRTISNKTVFGRSL